MVMSDPEECNEKGCGRVPHSRGLCATHYHAWYRNRDLPGTPVPPKQRRKDAKLTDEAVREIRARYKPGMGAKLAREFGVTTKTIHDIINRVTWKHVK